MDKERVRQMLPEAPPKELLSWALENYENEFGDQYLIYRSEMVEIYPTIQELMEWDNRPKTKRVRAARCECFACGEEFVTEVLPGGLGIKLFIGEDGQSFSVRPGNPVPPDAGGTEDDLDSMGYFVEYGEGDPLECPLCCSEVNLIKPARLRGGRTKQLLVAAIQRIGEYTAVVYWMCGRYIAPEGDCVGVYPRDAYVLTERGGLVRYTHTTAGGIAHESNSGEWRETSGCRDTMDKAYLDWGSINNRKCGGVFYPEVPDLDGTSGEKTGLADFARQREPIELVPYLRLWRRWKGIENLCTAGWTRLVEDIVKNTYLGYDPMVDVDLTVDRKKNKPHEMLGMSRAEHKAIRARGAQWGADEQRFYRALQARFGIGALEFMDHRKTFGASGLHAMIDLDKNYGDVTFEKVARYLSKQNMRAGEAGILLDTRRMAKQLAGERALTQEELWPRNLHSAHDRLTRMLTAQVDEAAARKYQEGFDLILKLYGDLEWTDGDLCIRLPRSNGELVTEGNMLRHCVGGYGQSHIKGNDVIFFVRKYRRPDRSYYTLDIGMNGKPTRRQLHGYGNEHHGDKKQYTHKIPQKVLDFCARWEKEVLMPWYYENQRKVEIGKELCERA